MVFGVSGLLFEVLFVVPADVGVITNHQRQGKCCFIGIEHFGVPKDTNNIKEETYLHFVLAHHLNGGLNENEIYSIRIRALEHDKTRRLHSKK